MPNDEQKIEDSAALKRELEKDDPNWRSIFSYIEAEVKKYPIRLLSEEIADLFYEKLYQLPTSISASEFFERWPSIFALLDPQHEAAGQLLKRTAGRINSEKDLAPKAIKDIGYGLRFLRPHEALNSGIDLICVALSRKFAKSLSDARFGFTSQEGELRPLKIWVEEKKTSSQYVSDSNPEGYLLDALFLTAKDNSLLFSGLRKHASTTEGKGIASLMQLLRLNANALLFRAQLAAGEERDRKRNEKKRSRYENNNEIEKYQIQPKGLQNILQCLRDAPAEASTPEEVSKFLSALNEHIRILPSSYSKASNLFLAELLNDLRPHLELQGAKDIITSVYKYAGRSKEMPDLEKLKTSGEYFKSNSYDLLQGAQDNEGKGLFIRDAEGGTTEIDFHGMSHSLARVFCELILERIAEDNFGNELLFIYGIGKHKSYAAGEMQSAVKGIFAKMGVILPDETFSIGAMAIDKLRPWYLLAKSTTLTPQTSWKIALSALEYNEPVSTWSAQFPNCIAHYINNGKESDVGTLNAILAGNAESLSSSRSSSLFDNTETTTTNEACNEALVAASEKYIAESASREHLRSLDFQQKIGIWRVIEGSLGTLELTNPLAHFISHIAKEFTELASQKNIIEPSDILFLCRVFAKLPDEKICHRALNSVVKHIATEYINLDLSANTEHVDTFEQIKEILETRISTAALDGESLPFHKNAITKLDQIVSDLGNLNGWDDAYNKLVRRLKDERAVYIAPPLLLERLLVAAANNGKLADGEEKHLLDACLASKVFLCLTSSSHNNETVSNSKSSNNGQLLAFSNRDGFPPQCYLFSEASGAAEQTINKIYALMASNSGAKIPSSISVTSVLVPAEDPLTHRKQLFSIAVHIANRLNVDINQDIGNPVYSADIDSFKASRAFNESDKKIFAFALINAIKEKDAEEKIKRVNFLLADAERRNPGVNLAKMLASTTQWCDFLAHEYPQVQAERKSAQEEKAIGFWRKKDSPPTDEGTAITVYLNTVTEYISKYRSSSSDLAKYWESATANWGEDPKLYFQKLRDSAIELRKNSPTKRADLEIARPQILNILEDKQWARVNAEITEAILQRASRPPNSVPDKFLRAFSRLSKSQDSEEEIVLSQELHQIMEGCTTQERRLLWAEVTEWGDLDDLSFSDYLKDRGKEIDRLRRDLDLSITLSPSDQQLIAFLAGKVRETPSLMNEIFDGKKWSNEFTDSIFEESVTYAVAFPTELTNLNPTYAPFFKALMTVDTTLKEFDWSQDIPALRKHAREKFAVFTDLYKRKARKDYLTQRMHAVNDNISFQNDRASWLTQTKLHGRSPESLEAEHGLLFQDMPESVSGKDYAVLKILNALFSRLTQSRTPKEFEAVLADNNLWKTPLLDKVPDDVIPFLTAIRDVYIRNNWLDEFDENVDILHENARNQCEIELEEQRTDLGHAAAEAVGSSQDQIAVNPQEWFQSPRHIAEEERNRILEMSNAVDQHSFLLCRDPVEQIFGNFNDGATSESSLDSVSTAIVFNKDAPIIESPYDGLSRVAVFRSGESHVIAVHLVSLDEALFWPDIADSRQSLAKETFDRVVGAKHELLLMPINLSALNPNHIISDKESHTWALLAIDVRSPFSPKIFSFVNTNTEKDHEHIRAIVIGLDKFVPKNSFANSLEFGWSKMELPYAVGEQGERHVRMAMRALLFQYRLNNDSLVYGPHSYGNEDKFDELRRANVGKYIAKLKDANSGSVEAKEAIVTHLLSNKDWFPQLNSHAEFEELKDDIGRVQLIQQKVDIQKALQGDSQHAEIAKILIGTFKFYCLAIGREMSDAAENHVQSKIKELRKRFVDDTINSDADKLIDSDITQLVALLKRLAKKHGYQWNYETLAAVGDELKKELETRRAKVASQLLEKELLPKWSRLLFFPVSGEPSESEKNSSNKVFLNNVSRLLGERQEATQSTILIDLINHKPTADNSGILTWLKEEGPSGQHCLNQIKDIASSPDVTDEALIEGYFNALDKQAKDVLLKLLSEVKTSLEDLEDPIFDSAEPQREREVRLIDVLNRFKPFSPQINARHLDYEQKRALDEPGWKAALQALKLSTGEQKRVNALRIYMSRHPHQEVARDKKNNCLSPLEDIRKHVRDGLVYEVASIENALRKLGLHHSETITEKLDDHTELHPNKEQWEIINAENQELKPFPKDASGSRSAIPLNISLVEFEIRGKKEKIECVLFCLRHDLTVAYVRPVSSFDEKLVEKMRDILSEQEKGPSISLDQRKVVRIPMEQQDRDRSRGRSSSSVGR
ncbi:MAG: hypothetical protein V4568_11800 [Pseudomonadota bacterium]